MNEKNASSNALLSQIEIQKNGLIDSVTSTIGKLSQDVDKLLNPGAELSSNMDSINEAIQEVLRAKIERLTSTSAIDLESSTQLGLKIQRIEKLLESWAELAEKIDELIPNLSALKAKLLSLDEQKDQKKTEGESAEKGEEEAVDYEAVFEIMLARSNPIVTPKEIQSFYARLARSKTAGGSHKKTSLEDHSATTSTSGTVYLFVALKQLLKCSEISRERVYNALCKTFGAKKVRSWGR